MKDLSNMKQKREIEEISGQEEDGEEEQEDERGRGLSWKRMDAMKIIRDTREMKSTK